jgi:hypothetical protein
MKIKSAINIGNFTKDSQFNSLKNNNGIIKFFLGVYF